MNLEMMIKKYILFTVLPIASVFSQSDVRILSLQDCVDMAIEKNISIKQSELSLMDSEINKSSAIGNFLPSINAQAQHQWNIGLSTNFTTNLLETNTTQFSSMGAGVGLDVYNGLSNVYQLHRANLQILASKYQLDNMKDDISLMVANAYLQIMFNSEILKVQESQLEITKVELLRTQDLIDAGIFSPKQIFEIEANLASQEQALIQAENNYRNAKLNLAQLLLIDDFESFDIANEDFDVPFSEILENSPFNRNKGQTFGLQLNVPIFNRMQTRNNIKRSEINLERIKYQFEQDKLDLENTVNQSYNDLKGAIKFYEASSKTLISLKNAFEDTTDRYRLGVLSSFDFIQAKQRYESAVSENIRAKFDYIFKLKVLEFYFGLPLSIPAN